MSPLQTSAGRRSLNRGRSPTQPPGHAARSLHPALGPDKQGPWVQLQAGAHTPPPRARGEGRGWACEWESFKSFFFLRRQGSPGADRGGQLVGERQIDSGCSATTPTGAPPAPHPSAPPPPAPRPQPPQPRPGLQEECVACLCPERGPEGPASARRAGHPRESPLEQPCEAAHSASQPSCHGQSQRARLCQTHTHSIHMHARTHATHTQRHTPHTHTHNTHTHRDTHTYTHTIHRDTQNIHTHRHMCTYNVNICTCIYS